MKGKDRSSHYRSNCINVPKFTNVAKGIRTVVFASLKLHQYLLIRLNSLSSPHYFLKDRSSR